MVVCIAIIALTQALVWLSFLLNPDYALDFIMKTKYTVKSRTHELFLDEQYFCILNLKIGVNT